MRRFRSLVFGTIAAACTLSAAFFAFFGAQLVHFALTYDGEGSLGHVGMYIAAFLFPPLALLFGALAYLAWRARARTP